MISVAAELTGLHPQTLRTYERMGLITPGRTGGGGRRYSPRDIDLLREIAQLTSAGIGIEGVRRILELENRVAALSSRNEELLAELEATREALRQAVAGRRTTPASRLPAVPQPPPSSRSWSGAAGADPRSGPASAGDPVIGAWRDRRRSVAVLATRGGLPASLRGPTRLSSDLVLGRTACSTAETDGARPRAAPVTQQAA